MKSINYILLSNELKKHECSLDGDYNLSNLFEFYADLELTTINDLLTKNVTKDFYNFIRSHEEYIKTNSKNPSRAIHSACIALTYNCLRPDSRTYEKELNRYKNFSKLVLSLTDNTQKILEVGAGKIPYSSIFTAMNGRQIDAMDMIALPNAIMKNFNVGRKKEFFDNNTDISKYDIVVGSMPCSAIESIVKLCANQDKSYLISLCNCELPEKPKYMEDDEPYSWINVLENYDSNIQQEGNFVFNINNKSKQEVSDIIKSIYPENPVFDASNTVIKLTDNYLIDNNIEVKELSKE